MKGSTTPPSIRLFSALLKLFLPAALLFAVAVAVAAYFLAADIATPPARSYLVTPGEYAVLSERGRQVTEETWTNPDGSVSRGWLLRGTVGAPAVIFLHSFGNDRSHVLNLGVRLNEATDYTVLMPDLRGHGMNPTVPYSSFGGCEADDLTGALGFLEELRSEDKRRQVGSGVGVYGVGIGSLAAIRASAKTDSITALLLDSIPADSEGVMRAVADRRFPMPSMSFPLTLAGTKLFYRDGCLRRESSCDLARTTKAKRVALFDGADFPELAVSTERVADCLPAELKPKVDVDLRVSGYAIMKASVKEAEEYSNKVTAYFKDALGN
jgi:pimeloyl-ACP methyl ester carboxylesterase